MAACSDHPLHAQRAKRTGGGFFMNFRTTLLCCLLPVSAFFCIGWADTWDEMKAAAGTVHSVQAEFAQEKHLPILAKPLLSKGRFYYQAPRSLRWEYHEPIRSILTMHGGRVKRYVADGSEWVQERGSGLEAMQFVVQEIAHWLSGRFDENPSFKARLEPGRRVVLTPRSEAFSGVIQQIVLNLGPEPGIMQSVVIRESPDAFTRLTFSHTRLNQPIEDAVFRNVP
jgi:outer membrane lipoprotein-sorting protein